MSPFEHSRAPLWCFYSHWATLALLYNINVRVVILKTHLKWVQFASIAFVAYLDKPTHVASIYLWLGMHKDCASRSMIWAIRYIEGLRFILGINIVSWVCLTIWLLVLFLDHYFSPSLAPSFFRDSVNLFLRVLRSL